MKAVFVYLIVLLVSGYSCYSQVKIQGKVTDVETGAAITGVSVSIPGQSRSTSTNDNGEFIIPAEKIPETLHFTHISYETQDIAANTRELNVKLQAAKTTLTAVILHQPSTSELLNQAWELAGKQQGKNYFAKAFYRQMTTINDTAREINELFYDLKWQVNRINGWHARESRYARLDSLKDVPVNNPSYLTFLFSGYLFKFANALYPEAGSIGKNYELHIEKYIAHPDQQIVVISCKVKADKRKSSSVYVDATYYIGADDLKIYKIESAVYNVPFMDTNIKSTLTSTATFVNRAFPVPVLDNIVTNLTVPYKKGKTVADVTIKSLIEVYDNGDIHPAVPYNLTTEFVIDRNVVKRTPYNPDFWSNNPIIRHTPVESSFVALMEDNHAFGTMSKSQHDVETDVNSPDFKVFYEKVYLHTDREDYMAGEAIWFKAYLVNAQNNQLFNSSNNLYVELINPDSKLRASRLIRLDRGLGQGDIQLTDSIPPGVYRLRAYTNWMRNFADNFIFEKEIRVYGEEKGVTAKSGSAKMEGESAKRKAESNLANTPAVATDPSPGIGFFPESGSMIEETPGIVAFKVEDANGHSVSIRQGSIQTASGDPLIAIDGSTGTGSFLLTPKAGEQYVATGTFSNGKTFHTQLPPALQKGFSMHLRNTDSLVTIFLSTNAATLAGAAGKSLTLLVKSRGKSVYAASIPINALQTQVSLSTDHFASGVNSLTVYDESRKPQCERLVYLEKERDMLTISTDKPVYAPKEKVTITLKTSDDASLPVSTHLSLAVVDAGIVPPGKVTIENYLSLQSELRGKVENPGQYFDSKNPARLQQLDLLLLTQGWRDFTWKRLADSINRISRVVEQGITVSGKVKQVWAGKGIPNLHVTMTAWGAEDTKLFTTLTNAEGKFYLDGAKLWGNQEIHLAIANNKGKKASGFIVADTVTTDIPFAAKYVEQHPPPLPFFEEEVQRRLILAKKVSLSDTIQLNAVNITTRLPGRTMSDSTLTVNRGDYTYPSLAEYFLAKVPGAVRYANRPEWVVIYGLRGDGSYGPRGFTFSADPPTARRLKLGVYYPKLAGRDYWNLSLDKINSIRVIHNRNHDGIYENFDGRLGDYFDVFLDVKPGAFDRQGFGNLNFDVDGYYEARTFYAPKYETIVAKPDLRTTLHWEPNIVTNEKGEATVTFYNADPKTTVRIVAEGITETGIPVSAVAEYKIN